MANQPSEYVECGRWMRWIVRGSLVLLVAGAVLLVVGLGTMNSAVGTGMYAAGIMAIIAGLLLRAVMILDRYVRSLLCLRLRRYSPLVTSEDSSVCQVCDEPLYDVAGPFCPPCGTVRPAPRDGAAS